MQAAHNLYIHIPFCKSKCNYCAFFSRACANPDWQTFEQSILSELDFWAQKLGHISIPSVFFGGGTPSLMPTDTFEKIMQKIQAVFNIEPNAEITLESNPGTLPDDKLADFIHAGINRLSVGVQSLNDDELKFMGRGHNANDAIKLIQSAQNKNISVSGDFIYGLPETNMQNVIQLCKQINELGLRHCSLYELTIEPDTPFGKMNLNMPNNSTMADTYLAIEEYLNLPRYEVSNYAQVGCECRHNQNIWDGAPYIGIGTGAAGRILIDNQWYEQFGNNALFEKLSDKSRGTEKIITGLRQNRGLLLNDSVLPYINTDFIAANQDLLTTKNNRLGATKKGLLILDEILLNLVK